jgi:hypothetical protein
MRKYWRAKARGERESGCGAEHKGVRVLSKSEGEGEKKGEWSRILLKMDDRFEAR